MPSLKKHLLVITAGLVLASCGGDGANETPAILGAIPQTQGPTQYEIKTQQARDAFEARLAEAQAASDDWMETNRREADVVTTTSGLQYRINKSTSNPDGKPYDADQEVIVHYEGRLTDGSVFDSSFNRGRAELLKPSELIEGWKEALTLMQPGDEWTLFIPPSLGYKDLGKGGGIPPNAVIIFDVELR